MTKISISYNENNEVAKKALDFMLSLGVFKVEKIESPAKRKTLKAIEDAKKGKGITQCNSFEEYLKAVSE